MLARIARLLKKNNAILTLRGLTLDCAAHEMSYGGYIGVYKDESGFVDLTDIPLVLGEVTYFIENSCSLRFIFYRDVFNSQTGY